MVEYSYVYDELKYVNTTNNIRAFISSEYTSCQYKKGNVFEKTKEILPHILTQSKKKIRIKK